MKKRLIITIDEEVYKRIYKVIGHRKISQFIESLVRPHVITQDLENGYREMAGDEEREAEALEWSEATIGDISDERR